MQDFSMEFTKGSKQCSIYWDRVCRQTHPGSLGLQNLQMANKALMLKLLWDFAKKVDFLWIKWMHKRCLKNTTIWEVDIDVSWSLRSILSLRGEVTSYVNLNTVT